MKLSTLWLLGFCLLASGCSDDPAGPQINLPAISHFTGTSVPVDTTGHVVNYQSLVIGADSHPRVAYEWTETVSIDYRGTVKYARYDGGRWLTETVSPEHEDAGSPELLIDPGGTPVMFYESRISSYHAELKYARRLENGQWESETVDSEGYVGTWSSAAFDGIGRLHVAYFAGYPNYDLRYARYADGIWEKELVDSEGETGYEVQLLIDSANEPYLGYGTTTTWKTRFASRTGSQWVIETLPGSYFGHRFAMSTNGTPKPIFALWSGSLVLAAHNGSSWTVEPIDDHGATGVGHSGLHQDSNSTLLVVYVRDSVQRIAWKHDLWNSQSIDGLFGDGVDGPSVINNDGGVSVLFTLGEQQLYYGTIQPVYTP